MENSNFFTEFLLLWYHDHKRDLPWRGEKDPYKIWISEVILQQTRVNQGYNYYLKFIETFKTIKDLANSHEEEVLKVWQGLGYYSRARNIHFAAKQIINDFDGVFPKQYENIRSLKGIGPYTAAAISAIAFELPHFAIDGNVLRVMSRIFGIFEDIGSKMAFNKINAIGSQLISNTIPSEFTQALMEFGAIHCTPQNPKCNECSFQNICYAFKNNLVEKLPVKVNKVKVVTRYFHFFIFSERNHILIQKREQKDIWNNLFQFPLIETEQQMIKPPKDLLNQIGISQSHEIQLVAEEKHKLTHQLLVIKFFKVLGPIPNEKPNQWMISKDQLKNKAFPIVLVRFINNYLLS